MEYSAADKYRSMMRSYDRLKRINTNNGNSISNTDVKDATEDFFNQCYHFKDWLKKDPAITLIQDVEIFVNKNRPLSLAADYCNSFKHGGLDKKSRSGEILKKINTHINFSFTVRGVVTSSRLELTIGYKKYDAFLLATKCIKKWKRFLKSNRVPFSNP